MVNGSGRKWNRIRMKSSELTMAVHINDLVLLQIMMILLLWTPFVKASPGQPSCPKNCGDVNIVYPFGIGEGCYLDERFEVECHESHQSPAGSAKAVLKSIDLELSAKYISYRYGIPNVSVNVSVIPMTGNSSSSNSPTSNINMASSPFSFSQKENRFVALRCDNYAQPNNNQSSSRCLSICICDPTRSRHCCYFSCTIPPDYSKILDANTSYIYSKSIPEECNSISMLGKDRIFGQDRVNDEVLKHEEQLPAVLEWGKDRGTCHEEYDSHTKTCSKDNQYCLLQMGSSYYCLCLTNSPDVPKDICSGPLICITTSKFNCAECPHGYNVSNDLYGQPQCSSINSLTSREIAGRGTFIIIGCGIGCGAGGFGMLILVVGAWWLYTFAKRRKELKLKHKFLKKNGGLLLQQELSSNENSIEKTKLFTSKALEKATDHFNVNRILGQGGQGTVYKGMLVDGKIVAVKRSKVIDESKVEEFINEVVLLSQINHRNVVSLLGCCLETEVPLLVYEFIPNGTLSQYIHDHQNEEFPIAWEMRLRIAVEVSGALSYLHSAASRPIFHRDIKSANILLDDKYRAKVSDFGASRSMAVDQTHMTTQVHGTYGYLDPEYFRSSLFTEKSDVYSFGVVLAELLTGQRPVRVTITEEDKSLAAYFQCAMKEDRLFEILDDPVLKDGDRDEIVSVAKLASRCLNLSGKKRPTMKEVASELAGIKELRGASTVLRDGLDEEIDCEVGDLAAGISQTDGSISFTGSFTDSITEFADAEDPLMPKNW